ncbi:MAG: hypothetical protein ACKVT2_04925 [Saprospiraceae bacterium]
MTTQKFKLPYVLLMAFFMLSLAQCSKDNQDTPCPNTTCNNGGTVTANCECECPCWYSGSTCDNEKTPTRIDIDKIVITKFPPTNGGAPWDPPGPNTWADLVVIVYKECSPGPWCDIFTSSEKVNCDPGQSHTFQLPATSLSKPLEKYRVSLYDDDLGGITLFIGGVTFTPYKVGEKFPNPIKVSSGSVDFELYVKYYFDPGCVKTQ